MSRFRWLPFIGWVDISSQEALDLDLPQAAREQWQLFCVAWLIFGFGIVARTRPS